MCALMSFSPCRCNCARRVTGSRFAGGRAFVLLAALGFGSAAADIPATPVLTLYRFNGDLNLPYYHVQRFEGRGSVAPAGLLAQGTRAYTLAPVLLLLLFIIGVVADRN